MDGEIEFLTYEEFEALPKKQQEEIEKSGFDGFVAFINEARKMDNLRPIKEGEYSGPPYS